MTEHKVIGQASIESQELFRRLKKAVDADDYAVISYGELSKLAGTDVQRDDRCYLDTARRMAERETGRLFGTVAGEGVKLLTPDEQVAQGSDVVARIRRATKRGITRVGRVQVEKLTDDQRKEYSTNASVLGALYHFSRPKSIEKIGTAVAKQDAGKLAIGDTLKLFAKE